MARSMRATDRWAQTKQRDLRETTNRWKFQRDPRVEAFQYSSDVGGTYARQMHDGSTGVLPLMMLSHFNCAENDVRCKVSFFL
jgi:hypothetical protein